MELLWCAVIGIGAGCSYYTGTPAVRPRFLWNSFSENVFLCKWTPHQRLFCLEDHLCVIFRDIFREGCYWIWISHDLVSQVNGSRQLHRSSRCLNTCAAWVSVERIEQIHCIDTVVWFHLIWMYKQLYGLPAASVVQWLAHQSDTQLAVVQPCIMRKVFENTTTHWQVLVQNSL